MLYTLLCIILVLLKLQIGVHGYMVDPDCGDDTQYVRDRVDTAFRLIANAVTELDRNPINPNIDVLHNTLFGLNWDESKPNNIKVRYQGLSQISQHNVNDQTRMDPIPANSIQDVRFYCTAKRIQKRRSGDKTEYMNKDRNIVYDPTDLTSPGGSYANCFDIIPSPTMMITMRVPNKYSEIQICPWYLSNARGFRIRDLSDVPSSVFTSISKLAIPALAKLMYRPIDTFVLTDKMIVHELTHTHQAKFPTEDMKPGAYGWKNARNLASIYMQGGQDYLLDPVGNADSLALFAVGAWILVQPGTAPIGTDGSFTKPQATPKAKI